MYDLAFKYPKKLLQVLLVGAMVVAIGWGVLTWNSQNAIELWTKEVTFITKPLFNYFSNRAARQMERIMKPALEQFSESYKQPSQEL